MKFIPIILLTALLFMATLYNVCQAQDPLHPFNGGPPVAHNRRRRQMDDVNLDGAIWVDEFPQGDDGNPQF
jgi:hypothetical protein